MEAREAMAKEVVYNIRREHQVRPSARLPGAQGSRGRDCMDRGPWDPGRRNLCFSNPGSRDQSSRDQVPMIQDPRF